MQTTTINSGKKKREAKDVWRVQSNKIALKQIVNKFIQIIMVVYFSSVHIITRPLLEIRIDFHLLDASDVSPDSDHHKQLHYYIFIYRSYARTYHWFQLACEERGARRRRGVCKWMYLQIRIWTRNTILSLSCFLMGDSSTPSTNTHLHLLLSQR